MTSHLKILAAALGLILATGAASASAVQPATTIQHGGAKVVTTGPVVRNHAVSHRLHIVSLAPAQFRHERALRPVHHVTRLSFQATGKTAKAAIPAPRRERQASNHRAAKATVIR